MIRWTIAAAVVALSSIAATYASAQELPERRANVRYVVVQMWKFAPGGRERALNIYDNYLAAMREAGAPMPTVVHPDTGPWDVVMLYPLGGGPSDLEYNLSPTDAKWWSLLEKKVGVTQARALGRELDQLIIQKDSYAGHEHVRP